MRSNRTHGRNVSVHPAARARRLRFPQTHVTRRHIGGRPAFFRDPARCRRFRGNEAADSFTRRSGPWRVRNVRAGFYTVTYRAIAGHCEVACRLLAHSCEVRHRTLGGGGEKMKWQTRRRTQITGPTDAMSGGRNDLSALASQF